MQDFSLYAAKNGKVNPATRYAPVATAAGALNNDIKFVPYRIASIFLCK